MFLNDYSQTIGAEIAQVSTMIPSNPAQFRAWAWKSANPEYLYVTLTQGNETVTRKFHYFLFTGKLAQVKVTSDKIHFRLSDETIKAIEADRLKGKASQLPAAK